MIFLLRRWKMANQQASRSSKSGKTTVTLSFKGNNGIVMGLNAVNERAPLNLQKYMEKKAVEAEQYMKTHHPWQNRTGRAERGLNAKVTRDDLSKTIHLGLYHSDIVWPWYGAYLEYGTSRMRAFPILEPTQRVFGPRLLNELNLSELYRFTGNPKV